MRHPAHDLILIFTTLIVFGMGIPAQSDDTEEGTSGLGSGAVVINSNRLEADDQKQTITFWGDVNAHRDDFTIDCQKMVVYLKKSAKTRPKEKESAQIDRIVATGEVKIVRSMGGTATARQAVYHEGEEKLVLTGDPVVKQENDFVTGDRITLFLKEDRSVVESSQDKKVKAVIFPKTGNRE
ncbi:MAG: lipopolysaccharide transport periplasmic protein LptA [Thermodesulfobacteriota bacterium]